MKNNHIHKFRKVDISSPTKDPYIVYQCVLPECTSYIRSDLAKNKMTLCWKCNEPFQLINLARVKPKCENCIADRQDNVEKLLKLTGVI